LWLKKIKPEKPWASLPLQFSPCVEALFYMAVSTNAGDGFNSLFWKDNWILGRWIQDIAPLIFSMVLKRFVNKRTVQKAIQDGRWIGDIRGVATVEVIREFLRL
jgi:hypothetical protein